MELTTNNINKALSNARRLLVSQNDERIQNKRKGLSFNCTENQCAQALIAALENAQSQTFSSISFQMFNITAEGTTTFRLFVIPAGTSTASYTVNIAAISTGLNNAALVVAAINNQFPSTFPFFAVANGVTVTVYGLNESARATQWTLQNVNPGGSISTSTLTMAGNTILETIPESIVTDFYENCITNEEAQQLFFKLNQLVSPCENLIS